MLPPKYISFIISFRKQLRCRAETEKLPYACLQTKVLDRKPADVTQKAMFVMVCPRIKNPTNDS